MFLLLFSDEPFASLKAAGARRSAAVGRSSSDRVAAVTPSASQGQAWSWDGSGAWSLWLDFILKASFFASQP